MRVALVCDYSLDYLGGAQAAFVDEARILAEHGHEVTVVAPRTHAGRRDHRAAADPVSLERAWVDARWTIPGVDLPLVRNSAALRRRLRTLLVDRRIEVVHLHSEFGLTAAATVVARELGIPVVMTVHTFFWQAGISGPLDRLAAAAVRSFARWVRGCAPSTQRLAPSALDSALRGTTLDTAMRAEAVISPSAHQADSLRDAGAPHVMVIENAAPSGIPDPELLTKVDLPLRVAWIGRLVPEKRILEFIAAVTAAAKTLGPGMIQADVIGDGPLAEPAAAAVRAVEVPAGGVAPVRLRGRLPRDAVREAIRDAHLVALTSFDFDNQPVVVVEALTEARSVLYVDPKLREGLADGGILADSETVDGMAQALVRLARDPAAVVEASARALAAAHVFSPGRHAEMLRRAYESALARTDGSDPVTPS